MRTLYYLVATLCCWLPSQVNLANSYGILTKNMIRTADQRRYEPVTLFTKDNFTNQIVTDIPEELTTWTEEIPPASEQDYNEDDDLEEDEDEQEANENEEGVGTEGPQRILKTESSGRTRLYPVGRLWEKARADIWTVLSAAVNCIWSGLSIDCFKFRVMPMVKSLMGYQYSEYQPFSREDEAETELEEGRRRRPHHLLGLLKIMKGALAGAIGFKTLLLPVLAALAIVAAKSLMLSFASVLISAAAAWSGIKYAADRRIQAGVLADGAHPQYYMM